MAQMRENYSVTLGHAYTNNIIHLGMTWELITLLICLELVSRGPPTL